MNWEIAEVKPQHKHIRCAKYGDLLDYNFAVGGDGPHAFTWSDKPHRLVYDLTAMATEYRDEITRLRAALTEIAEINPDNSSDNGFNEWGWADCAHKAIDIAKEALG